MPDPIKQLLAGMEMLNQDNLDEAQKFFLDCSASSSSKLKLSINSAEKIEIVVNFSYIMQAAAWYYLIHALKNLRQNDNIAYLGYLCYTSGIMAVLDTLIAPILRMNTEKYFSPEEISSLLRIAGNLDDRTGKLLIDATNRLRKEEEKEYHEKLEETFRKVLNALDPLAEEIREKSVRLASPFTAGNFKQARRIFEFVRDEIRYIHDPFGFEKVQSPIETLRLGGGDCEDKAILLASLLSSIGFETAMVFADTNEDRIADHVYCAVYIKDAPDYCKPLPHKDLPDGKDLHDWIPLDPTLEDAEFGMIPLSDLEIIKFIPTILRGTSHP